MSLVRGALRASAFAFVVLLSGVGVFLAYLFAVAVPEPEYLDRRGQLASAVELARYPFAGGRIEELELTSSTGVRFQVGLRIPDDPLPGRPLVLLLAGNETGRKAVTMIRDPGGIAVAALGYPFAEIPYRDWLPLLLALPDIQRGILDTPSAVLLALDYLHARPDLRPERIELAGVSFGAYLAAVPATLDPRVDRLWLIHGSGQPGEVIKYGLEGRLPARWLSSTIGGFLARIAGTEHLSPERWVGRYAPRPLVVINADADESIPIRAIAALHEAVPGGTEILWTPGDHVHPKRPEIMSLVSAMIRERIYAAAGQP